MACTRPIRGQLVRLLSPLKYDCKAATLAVSFFLPDRFKRRRRSFNRFRISSHNSAVSSCCRLFSSITSVVSSRSSAGRLSNSSGESPISCPTFANVFVHSSGENKITSNSGSSARSLLRTIGFINSSMPCPEAAEKLPSGEKRGSISSSTSSRTCSDCRPAAFPLRFDVS